MKPTGYIVFEDCDDFEQSLALDRAANRPAGGVLYWRGKMEPATVFPDRKSARDAITRTEHFRLAFNSDHPERKFCKLVPVKLI